MDAVHLYGVHFIGELQSYFSRKWQEEFFFIFSHIGDPKNAFILYFPILFAWRKCEGRRLLMAAVASEWLNLILKWCLRGERPYWWVYEANVSSVSLKQFYLTCETGPGSPSGHVMVTCAVGLFIVLAVTSQPNQSGQSTQFLRITTWFVYLAIVFVVSVSRIYIAAHFPHQIILAFFVGNAIGKWIWTDVRDKVPSFYFLWSVLLVIFTLVIHTFLSLFSDPAFSIPKATKWCSNKDYIRLDTTPFYAMVRDSGAILGIGISEFLRKSNGGTDLHFSAMNCVLQTSLSIFFARCLESIPFPPYDPLMFYLFGFGKNVSLVLIVMVVVPIIADHLGPAISTKDSS